MKFKSNSQMESKRICAGFVSHIVEDVHYEISAEPA